MAITIRSLSLSKAKKQILNNINLDIAEGEVVYIAGRNGAGKSTLFRSMLGMESQATGESIIDHVLMSSPDRYRALQKIGAVLFSDTAYTYLSGRTNLSIVQRFYKETLSIKEVVELVGLSEVIDQPVKLYSSGMKQRLNIAMALINNPSLLILDEPFNSIDQENTTEIIKLIKFLNQSQKITILLSTHAIHEAESIYTRFVFLQKGNIIFDQFKDIIQHSSLDQILSDYLGNNNLLDGVDTGLYGKENITLPVLYQYFTK